MLKNLDYNEKKFFFLGSVPILIKIILLVLNPRYLGVITLLDILFSAGIVFLRVFGEPDYDNVSGYLTCVYAVIAVTTATFLVLTIPLELLLKGKESLLQAQKVFFALSGVNGAMVIISLFMYPAEQGFNSLIKYTKGRKEEKIIRAVKYEAYYMVDRLEEETWAIDKFKKKSKNISSRFASEEKELIDNTTSLIKDFLDNSLYYLDPEELIGSKGLDKSYSEYFEEVFKERGFSILGVKDFYTFFDVADYGLDYIKVIENLDLDSSASNLKILEELYADTKEFIGRVKSKEENKMKEELKSLIDIEIARLNKAKLKANLL